MKQMTFEIINLSKSDNLVITEDNLMSIGQKITYCSFRCIERYHYINLSYYSKGMYKSVMHFNEPNETLSDGYEIMQECMLYLCKYLGRKLGDICKYDRHGEPVTILRDCSRFTTNYILHFLKLNENIVELEDGKKKPYHEVSDATEESYDRVEAIIEKLELTEKQRMVLDRYINNDRLTDIATELNISCSQVCNTRNSIKKRYLKRIAQVQC